MTRKEAQTSRVIPKSKRIRNNPYAIKGREVSPLEGGLIVTRRQPNGTVVRITLDEKGEPINTVVENRTGVDMSFAKVSIVGHLGQDPEVRYTPSGAMNIQFSIAADGRRRSGEGSDQDTTTWFRVTAWDKQAERLVSLIERGYIAKGRQLYVEGQLESRQYTDRNNQTRTSLDVSLSDFQFVGSRQEDQGAQGGAAPAGGIQGGGAQGGYGGSNYGNSPDAGDFGGDNDSKSLNDVPF